MPDERTDAIAREAARRLETDESPDLAHAVRAAAQHLGLEDAPPPGALLVRRHAQGIRMQALGDAGYRASVRDVLRCAEEIMTILETDLPDVETLLVGRAAQGNTDGGVVLHVRVYTDSPIREIALALVAHDCAEPTFETADTASGRLDRIRFVEEGQEVVVTRCPSSLRADAKRDLFSGKGIAGLTLAQLRAKLDPRSTS